MTLLDSFYDLHFNTWLYARTDKHTEKSYIRFVSIEDQVKRNRRSKYIKVFAYYAKTDRISYYQIDSINHFSFIEIIDEMDQETEDKLNALFARELLTQRL